MLLAFKILQINMKSVVVITHNNEYSTVGRKGKTNVAGSVVRACGCGSRPERAGAGRSEPDAGCVWPRLQLRK